MDDPLALIHRSIGGDEPYYRLVDAFYAGVEGDAVLRPLYPEDLTGSKRHLALFLIQRTGGHPTYSNERGHPRMRARHMPFPIGESERDQWLMCMNRALEEVVDNALTRVQIARSFAQLADFMRNKEG